MVRAEKVAVVDQVREQLTSNPATLFTDYRGLTVPELAELRDRLREVGARYVVVKNTLAQIAARDAGYGDLDDVLTGPTALTYCADDPVSPAKALRDFARAHPELTFKGGILEGRFVDAAAAEKLADLESREELLGRFAGMLYASLANAASLFQAPLAQVARLVQALEDKGEQPAEDVDAAAEPPTAETPADQEEETPGEEPAAEPAAEETGPEADQEPQPAAAALPVDGARDTAAAVVGTVGETVAGSVEAAGSAVESAADSLAEVPEDAGEAVADAVEGAGDAAEDAVETAGEALESAAEAVGDAVRSATDSAADALRGPDAEEPEGPAS
ncbi:MAG: 50S ribosomal protein L10 [Actinomycetota bacterium]|nr:50S ribosomal protein L10 [Actinomycetota bacterium]